MLCLFVPSASVSTLPPMFQLSCRIAFEQFLLCISEPKHDRAYQAKHAVMHDSVMKGGAIK